MERGGGGGAPCHMCILRARYPGLLPLDFRSHCSVPKQQMRSVGETQGALVATTGVHAQPAVTAIGTAWAGREQGWAAAIVGCCKEEVCNKLLKSSRLPGVTPPPTCTQRFRSTTLATSTRRSSCQAAVGVLHPAVRVAVCAPPTGRRGTIVL